jgi:hypothetical protein
MSIDKKLVIPAKAGIALAVASPQTTKSKERFPPSRE